MKLYIDEKYILDLLNLYIFIFIFLLAIHKRQRWWWSSSSDILLESPHSFIKLLKKIGLFVDLLLASLSLVSTHFICIVKLHLLVKHVFVILIIQSGVRKIQISRINAHLRSVKKHNKKIKLFCFKWPALKII